MLAFLSVVSFAPGVSHPSEALADALVAIKPRIRGARCASSIRAPVAVDLEQRIDDQGDEREPEKLTDARLPHADARCVHEHPTRERPVEHGSVTIAQTVYRDAIFAVGAQAEIADPDPEGDPQQPFERV